MQRFWNPEPATTFFSFFIHKLDVALHAGTNLYQLQDDILWQSFRLL